MVEPETIIITVLIQVKTVDPVVAEAEHKKFPWEVLFRSLHRLPNAH